MEPVTVILLVVVGVFGFIGGLGTSQLVQPAGADVTITDQAAVAEAETEQVYSLDRVIGEVCARRDPAGVELCDLLTCRQQSRAAGGGVAESTCDGVSNVAASRRAHAYCVDYALEAAKDDPVARASAETRCLVWFGQRK